MFEKQLKRICMRLGRFSVGGKCLLRVFLLFFFVFLLEGKSSVGVFFFMRSASSRAAAFFFCAVRHVFEGR